MFFRHLKTGLFIAAALSLAACTETPVPPEFQQALSRQEELRRTGAETYAPLQYRQFVQTLETGRKLLETEQEKWLLFRHYQRAQDTLVSALQQGEEVARLAKKEQDRQRNDLSRRIEELSNRLDTLRRLATTLKDSRLARRRLVESELILEEARARLGRGAREEALAATDRAAEHIAPLISQTRTLLGRYTEAEPIGRWRKWVQTAVAESAKKKEYLIVVSKLERELVLFKNGAVLHRYPAGLGFNFLSDKIQAGDRATPEGRYEIIKKVPNSRFFKALLINYPNSEDRARFAKARQQGAITSGVQIGGLIEIHGGGKDGMTNGCVALENNPMLALYEKVGTGTPVVIVGTLTDENIVVSSLKALQ